MVDISYVYYLFQDQTVEMEVESDEESDDEDDEDEDEDEGRPGITRDDTQVQVKQNSLT